MFVLGYPLWYLEKAAAISEPRRFRERLFLNLSGLIQTLLIVAF